MVELTGVLWSTCCSECFTINSAISEKLQYWEIYAAFLTCSRSWRHCWPSWTSSPPSPRRSERPRWTPPWCRHRKSPEGKTRRHGMNPGRCSNRSSVKRDADLTPKTGRTNTHPFSVTVTRAMLLDVHCTVHAPHHHTLCDRVEMVTCSPV